MHARSQLIPDKSLRVGSWVVYGGMGASWSWRHYDCVTDKQIGNILGEVHDVRALGGFDLLGEADQERVRAAFDAGSIKSE